MLEVRADVSHDIVNIVMLLFLPSVQQRLILEVKSSTVRLSKTLQDLIVLARRCCMACGNPLVLQLISEVHPDDSVVSNWKMSKVNPKSVTACSPAAQYSLLFAQVLLL